MKITNPAWLSLAQETKLLFDAFYKMYPVEGNNVILDYSGGNKHITPVDVTGDAAGKTEGAMILNGTSSYLRLPNDIINEFPFSFTAWFKTSANQSGGILGYQNVLPYNNSGYYIPLCYIGTDYKLRVGNYDGQRRTIVTPNVVNNDVWHLVCGVYTQRTIKMYFDGTDVGTYNASQDFYAVNGFAYKQFGAAFTQTWPSSPGSPYWTRFNGQMGQCIMFKRELEFNEYMNIWSLGNGKILSNF